MVEAIFSIMQLKPCLIASPYSHCTTEIFPSLIKLILYFCLFSKIGELVGMSGVFALAIMGLFLNSTSLKPGVESLLLE